MPAVLEKAAHPRRRSSKSRQPALYRGLGLSLEDFLEWKPEESDGWKYEWVDGALVAEEESMKANERFIAINIIDAFGRTRCHADGARILAESDVKLPGLDRGRRPDLACFTREQIIKSRRNPEVVPAFVIELVTRHDRATNLEEKLRDYFDAGVQCVWLVFPQMKAVRVYRSMNATEFLKGAQEVSAAPAWPEFHMRVKEIFA